MKKLFKVLALVLALTLVVGAIPASADATYNIKAKRTLYVALTDDADLSEPTARGTKTDADGTVTKSTAKARLSYAALLGISKEEAEKHVISVASDNASVVKANDDTQHIRAYEIGKAKLTITVDNKVEGTVTITAKKSSTDDTIVFGQSRDVFEDRKVTLNKEYTLSLPRAGKDTDNRKLVIKNEKGEDVTKDVAVEKFDEKGKSLRLWTLKFTAAGKYTIQGFGFQSAKYPDVISTGKAITVEAIKALPEKIAQTASNAFTMYFEDGVVVDKNEFSAAVGNYEDSIYELISGSKVPFGLIEKDGIAFAKDAEGKDIQNQIVVTTYKDYEGGKTYYVKYAGKDEPYSFEAVGNAATNVTAVKILRQTVPAGDNYDAWVHAYNGDVDITHALDMENVVNLSGSNDYAWTSGLTVYFSEANRSCTFTATLSKGYDNNGSEITVKSEPATITSYDGAEISDVIYRFKAAGNYNEIEALDETKDASLKRIAVGDQNYYLQMKVKNAAGKYVTLEEAGVTSIKIANQNIAIIKAGNPGTVGTSDKGFLVEAINAGETSVVLYKERPSDGKEIAVKSCNFTVLASRIVNEVKVEFDKQQLNLSMGANDAVVYTITVKDQHGDPVTGLGLITNPGNGLQVEQTDNKKNGTVNVANGTLEEQGYPAGTYKYTITGNDVRIATDDDGNDVVKVANFQLTFKAQIGWWHAVSASKGLTATKKGLTPKTWNVIASGYSLDTNIVTDTWPGSQSLKVWGYADGYVVSKESLYRIDEVPTNKYTVQDLIDNSTIANVAPEGGLFFVYTIKKGSTLVTRYMETAAYADQKNNYSYTSMATNIDKATASKVITLNNIVNDCVPVSCGAVTVSGSAIKLGNDKYTFDFYKVVVNNEGKVTVTKIGGSQIITVTNNQTAVVAEKKKDTVESIDAKDVAKAFKFSINGVEIDSYNVVSGEISLSNNGDYYVKKLRIRYVAKNVGPWVTDDGVNYYPVGAVVTTDVTINKLMRQE